MGLKTYKLRDDGNSAQLTVPAELARRIPDDVRFIPEVTDDGILFRAVREPIGGEPEWLAGDAPVSSGTATTQAKAPKKRVARRLDPKKAKKEPATPRQTIAFFYGTKLDVRPLNWNKLEASEWLDRLNGEGIPKAELDKLVEQGAVDRRRS